MKSKKIVCFGEILWDLLPNGKRLGGAPYNVANSLKSLGADVYLISRFGKDTLGDKLLEQVKIKGVPTDYLQIDPTHETGKVIVTHGTPSLLSHSQVIRSSATPRFSTLTISTVKAFLIDSKKSKFKLN